ncbi:hypothetical protein N7481_009451 [Penicillium waksmanii]|uniref:uncharacterized protein n=1 Tax=Penicillium waksmanii TaxID=69791 RepID=UPI0025495968|nr:uncharacterized protein N7481_009451 [Penicillium waksmanii]KAJ5975744.1 hypothetical protein N7481_009451 [Penicillium waksmanii]
MVVMVEDYAKDDPRYWRVECDDETKPLGEHLDFLKQRFQNLNWIPHVQKVGSWPVILEWYDEVWGDKKGKAMREIYLKHG